MFKDISLIKIINNWFGLFLNAYIAKYISYSHKAIDNSIGTRAHSHSKMSAGVKLATPDFEKLNKKMLAFFDTSQLEMNEEKSKPCLA